MKPTRLTVLVAIMVAAAVLRITLPSGVPAPQLAEPIVRHPEASTAKPRASVVEPTMGPATSRSIEPDDVVAGNAFSVKGPPVTALPVPAPVVVAVSAPMPIQPELPPPPPPVPLQVIGTYDDGNGPAVFVAGPGGTFLARQGTVLLATYRVTAITTRKVSLIEQATQQTTQLSIPTGPVR